MAMVAEAGNHGPDALTLRLHRYLWQPARYAHPAWFNAMGFHPASEWRYGMRPTLDRCLNHALLARRGTPALPTQLNARQQQLARFAPKITAFALALGLIKLGCGDYFLLPDYRKVLRHWLDETLLWRLFGLCQGQRRAVFSPEALPAIAIDLGSGMLYREAQHEPVLYAQLILLPPPMRALWPQVPTALMNLLERMLCLSDNCH